jgi:hypothetical protein
VDLPLKAQATLSRSRISSYKADALDMNLRDVLHEFRRGATTTKFGRVVLKNSGPGVVMSNEVLQRIVDCAHFYKIQSTEQLARETRWAGAGEFGEAVIALIKEHRPAPEEPLPALVTTTPLGPRTTNTETSVGRSVQLRKCSKCHTAGHIGILFFLFCYSAHTDIPQASNRKCPLHPRNEPTNPAGESTQATPSTSDSQNIIEIITPTTLPRPQPRPFYGQFRIPHTPFLPSAPSASSTEALPLAGVVFNPVTQLPAYLPFNAGFNSPLSPPETPSIAANPAPSSSPFPSIPEFRSTMLAFHFYSD